MFNEIDREALTDAAGMLEGKLRHTGELTTDDLVTALDHAGIVGLFHDGTRAERRVGERPASNTGDEIGPLEERAR